MLQHHKKLSLDLDKGQLIPNGGLQPDEEAGTAAASSAFQWKLRGSAKSRIKPLRSSGEHLDALERQDRRSADPADVKVQALDVNGSPARVTISQHGVEWTYSPRRGCLAPPATSETVPFSEVLSVQQLDPVWRGAMQCARVKVHRLLLYTFKRSAKERCVWAPRRIVFESPSQDVIKDWQALMAAGISAASAGRPSHLLVIMNPNSGARRARTVYQRIVAPVFRAGGAKTTVHETEYAGHAQAMVEGLRLEDVEGIDGIVAVGGDGVFHEVFNGMLRARAAAGPELQARLMQLRVAHIPAGSTDAVACTLHGTRSVFTAAMHIALGDRTELDILRVDTREGATRFASCIAAFGFMGDVMEASEGYRWLGPVRYDLVGAAKLLANNVYRAKVSYLQGAHSSHDAHSVCGANCRVCRAASFIRKNASPASPSLLPLPPLTSSLSPSKAAAGATELAALSGGAAAAVGDAELASPGTSFVIPVIHESAAAALLPPAVLGAGSSDASGAGEGSSSPRRPGAGALPADGGSPTHHHFLQPASSAHERHSDSWRVVEGEFVSIMLIVMPCLSEKTRQGMARYGHLADGRLKLVLVKRCNALQYLRFLLSMSRTGVFPGQHPYVDVIDAVAVKVECQGKASPWNLDGELLSTQCLSAEVHQGLLEVFARGVER